MVYWPRKLGQNKHELDINLAWSLANHDQTESLVKSYKMNLNGLKGFLFSDEILNNWLGLGLFYVTKPLGLLPTFGIRLLGLPFPLRQAVYLVSLIDLS